VGALASDLIAYWLHRGMHRVPWLWRWTHQMHHSAERMDLAGMSYAHPFDTLIVFSATGLVTALLGLTPDAAALAGFLGYMSAVVQHMNIRTPRWIGHIIMRPEAHGLHHERGVHAYNYASFPIWDIAFGTFRNPESFPEHYGFWPGASAQLGPMLLGRDVGEPERR
jgi:sterol desaturase/sphingolipid hydroxylase (fatty acid hydroxylase superfamily)